MMGAVSMADLLRDEVAEREAVRQVVARMRADAVELQGRLRQSDSVVSIANLIDRLSNELDDQAIAIEATLAALAGYHGAEVQR